MRCATQHPGELCRRLLVRMAQGLGRLGGDADQHTAPPVGTAYLAAVLVPTQSSTHTVSPRYRHEFAILATVIDHTARGEYLSAADTLAQRLKAFEAAVRARGLALVAGDAALAESCDTKVAVGKPPGDAAGEVAEGRGKDLEGHGPGVERGGRRLPVHWAVGCAPRRHRTMDRAAGRCLRRRTQKVPCLQARPRGAANCPVGYSGCSPRALHGVEALASSSAVRTHGVGPAGASLHQPGLVRGLHAPPGAAMAPAGAVGSAGRIPRFVVNAVSRFLGGAASADEWAFFATRYNYDGSAIVVALRLE